jgi:hypothetical protein
MFQTKHVKVFGSRLNIDSNRRVNVFKSEISWNNRTRKANGNVTFGSSKGPTVSNTVISLHEDAQSARCECWFINRLLALYYLLEEGQLVMLDQ